MMKSRRPVLIIGLLLAIALIAVGVWLLLGLEAKDPPAELRVVKQTQQGGKQVVVFRASIAKQRPAMLVRIYLSKGLASATNETRYMPQTYLHEWRHPQFTSPGGEGMIFTGAIEFSIMAPSDWPVWRLRADADVELNATKSLKEKLDNLWGIFRQPAPSMGRAPAIKQILQGHFFGRAQSIESEAVTNVLPDALEETDRQNQKVHTNR